MSMNNKNRIIHGKNTVETMKGCLKIGFNYVHKTKQQLCNTESLLADMLSKDTSMSRPIPHDLGLLGSELKLKLFSRNDHH